MRRLFFASAAVGLLGLALGCHHMHGGCDCDQGNDPCCYSNAPTPVSAHTAAPPIAAPAGPVAPAATTTPADQGREKLPPPADKEK